MSDKLGQLTIKKNKIDGFRPLPPELVRNLDAWFKIELTYTSNAIEGNTLTRAETALVVEKGLTVKGKSLREHLEAANHVEALEYVKTLIGKKRSEITEQDILNIHRFILNKIESDNAGRYRQNHARIAGSRVILPNPVKIPKLMQDFMDWLENINPDHVAKIASDAHYRLVSIHPFTDGNGRTLRLLMNLLLMQDGYPPAIIRKEDRLEYINSLEKAQTGGSLDDFYNLIYDAVDRSLDIYLEALELEPFIAKEPAVKQRFYTTDEVAKLLRVDPESVRRYVRSGKLRALKLGGKFIRIDRADLDRFIDQLKTGGKD
ncbi:MAG: helix-turn-helix domain-containing protein [Actinobacteria bacterium]|nr:helix-turn-helix domain-containing protein [Actinomycetota bacterium]